MGNQQSSLTKNEIEAIEHIEKYKSLIINPQTLNKIVKRILPEISKRKIKVKDISVSKLRKNTHTLFREDSYIDVSNVVNLSFAYCSGVKDIEFPQFPQLRRISFIGTQLTNENFLKSFEPSKLLISECDLRGNFFNSFPQRITSYRNLTRLNLMGLQLEELPLLNYPHLIYLNISENRLKKFDDEYVNGLPNLSILICFDNQIDTFFTKYPPQLTQMNCSRNPIERLPSDSFLDTITDFSACYTNIKTLNLQNAKSLEKLYLCCNEMDGSLDLKDCFHLVSLDCSNNQISSLKNLNHCLFLQEIYVGKNNLHNDFLEQLVVIPEEQLDEFNEKKEQIFPRKQHLRRLSCGYNEQINQIPLDFFKILSSLQFIDFCGTNITEIRKDFINDGSKRYQLNLLISDTPQLKTFPVQEMDFSNLTYLMYWGTSKEIFTQFSEKLKESPKRKRMIPSIPKVKVSNIWLNSQQKGEENEKAFASFESIKGPYRMYNEDAHCDEMICNGKVRFLSVFDGHGGYACSNRCSVEFPKILNKRLTVFLNHKSSKEGEEEGVKKEKTKEDWSKVINESVQEMLQLLKNENIQDGCTMIGCLVYKDYLITMNLGDSRGIALSLAEENIFELSRDHKPTDFIEWTLLKKRHHVLVNSKVDGVIGVTRSFGDFSHDLYYRTEVLVINRKEKNIDVLVLGCDGVFDVLSNDDVAQIVKTQLLENERQVDYIAQRIVNTALSANSRDNISCCVCHFKNKE